MNKQVNCKLKLLQIPRNQRFRLSAALDVPKLVAEIELCGDQIGPAGGAVRLGVS